MPFLITTKHPKLAVRRKVELTTFEAQYEVASEIGRVFWRDEAPGAAWNGAFTVSERDLADKAIGDEGGTFGPMHDGTTIVSTPIDCGWIADQVGEPRTLDGVYNGEHATMLAEKYNIKQGVSE